MIKQGTDGEAMVGWKGKERNGGNQNKSWKKQRKGKKVVRN